MRTNPDFLKEALAAVLSKFEIFFYDTVEELGKKYCLAIKIFSL